MEGLGIEPQGEIDDVGLSERVTGGGEDLPDGEVVQVTLVAPGGAHERASVQAPMTMKPTPAT